ncbi:MAG: hypothetical protein WC627_06670 [Legionella sp.]|jgi:hypothetical protein
MTLDEILKKYVEEKLLESNLVSMLPRFKKFITYGIKLNIGSFCGIQNYNYAINQYGKDCIGFKLEFVKQFSEKNSALLGRVIYNLKEQKKINFCMDNIII